MPVHVSNGNIKIGHTGNISLPPGLTCVPDVSCFNLGCYAKACYQYPEPRQQWTENLDFYNNYPIWYFAQILAVLQEKKFNFFRWHVGGDIPDTWYLASMMELARYFKNMRFLAYTKRYNFDYDNLPSNLTIIMSCWPGYRLPDNNLPRFWVQDGTENRVPDNAFPCPGECENCCKCWNLKKGEHVVILKHGRYATNEVGQCILPLEY